MDAALAAYSREAPSAIDQSHMLALVHGRLVGVREIARVSVVHSNGDGPVARFLRVLLHFIAGIRARACAENCRGRVAAAAADLMAEHAADDAAGDETESGSLTFFLDELNPIDDAAGRARA